MISGRVRALNLTVPLGSGRVGSDDLGYGPVSGFSFEPVQTSSTGNKLTINKEYCSSHKKKIRLPLRQSNIYISLFLHQIGRNVAFLTLQLNNQIETRSLGGT